MSAAKCFGSRLGDPSLNDFSQPQYGSRSTDGDVSMHALGQLTVGLEAASFESFLNAAIPACGSRFRWQENEDERHDQSDERDQQDPSPPTGAICVVEAPNPYR